MWAKLALGGFGRRGLEAVIAALVLLVAIAIVAASLMVVEGAADAVARTERADRPDIVHVRARFNRALFETPRSGLLPPLTLPVYEPLIDPQILVGAAGDAAVLARQSLLRNVVFPDGFLNVYIFGIDPDLESKASTFSLVRGRFLRRGDDGAAVVDQATARALKVDVGSSFPVRKADGQDMSLTVVGVLDGLQIHDAPPRTIEAPSLAPNSNAVSSGVFVSLRTSQDIFGRDTLTDALVIARASAAVPSLVERLQEAFRLEPGVFVTERYGQFRRKVRDFELTLALFALLSAATAVVAGSFAANLLHDVYADRRHQQAMLVALGFSPLRGALPNLSLGLVIALFGATVGSLVALLVCPTHFSMPSLMADLGTIEPRFGTPVATTAVVVALAAVLLGMAPTAWRFYRHPIATTLSEVGP
ncbi:ABC transporter permease [Mesorhizobium captivum]|uniref:ABC transporter permease n=1 Tax=Mesorhizobium captivum TaxID=3072319 RepID=UPI002A23D19A|nr:ABC transporter permease [Mesorhizobium sp. VK23E]MDX8512140.1 ABC transporter permease [Mesorhizobium sp. VK23E]